MRTCSRCKTLKSREAFHRNLSRCDGLQSQCKPCAKISTKEYHERYPGKERNWRLLREYGITADQYLALSAAQEDRCFICQRKMKLCVDHDHLTKAVRGLLCRKCNSGIGLLSDDAGKLARALQYLTKALPVVG